jgi:hypothetical protein
MPLLKLLLILFQQMKIQICMKMAPLELLLVKEHIVENQWGDLGFLSMAVLDYLVLVVVWYRDRSIQERY